MTVAEWKENVPVCPVHTSSVPRPIPRDGENQWCWGVSTAHCQDSRGPAFLLLLPPAPVGEFHTLFSAITSPPPSLHPHWWENKKLPQGDILPLPTCLPSYLHLYWTHFPERPHSSLQLLPKSPWPCPARKWSSVVLPESSPGISYQCALTPW